MTGLNEFLALFGNITLAEIVVFVFAMIFLFLIYKEIKKYVDAKVKEQHDKEAVDKAYKQKLEEAWSATQKYPEYRQQSIKIQGLLESEIQEVKDTETTITEALKKLSERLERMEEDTKRRERNQLRDLLLKNYRHYTNKELNPTQSWTKMEAEAFWELFSDYEDAGGNGYMHTIVQPEMNKLIVTDH